MASELSVSKFTGDYYLAFPCLETNKNSQALKMPTIVDKTNGLIKFMYSPVLSAQWNQPAYCFSVLHPLCKKEIVVAEPVLRAGCINYAPALTIKTIKITFECVGLSIKISEEDPDTTPDKPNEYYIDTKPVENVASTLAKTPYPMVYQFVRFKPELVKLETAKARCLNLSIKYPLIEFRFTGSNHFGVFAYGVDIALHSEGYFFWANPQTDELVEVGHFRQDDLPKIEFDEMQIMNSDTCATDITEFLYGNVLIGMQNTLQGYQFYLNHTRVMEI